MVLFAGYDVAIALVGIMLAVFGIVLGIGIAMEDRKLKDLGRGEIYQALINGAVIGVLFVAFSSGGVVSQMLQGAVNSTSASVHCAEPMANNAALCFAYNYLSNPLPIQVGNGSAPTLFDAVIGLLIPTTLLAALVGLISSFGFSFIVTFNLQSALLPFVHQLNYIVGALTFALIGIEVQAALMQFISIVGIPMLLPLGMILRSFFPTRKLGGAIMAIAIGLSTVFPLTYILDFQMSQSYTSISANSIINAAVANAQSLQGSLFGNVNSTTANSLNSTSLGPLTSSASLAISFMSGSSEFLQSVTSEVSALIIQVFFFHASSKIIILFFLFDIGIECIFSIKSSKIAHAELLLFASSGSFARLML